MMKATAIVIAAAAVPGAMADFWMSYLNRIEDTGRGAPTEAGVAFLKDPAITCDDVLSPKIWLNVGDASDDHPGMRTVPGDDVGAPLYRDPLDTVEFNTLSEAPGHHTIYKSRDYIMVDVNGDKSGQCYLNRSFVYDLDCSTQNEQVHLLGSSMFFCESDIEL
ncbi:hypothetical protein F4818DRAFT_452954 [Hypoxylon cercidicola]|nr:hypothetical protein F4818DRAFT_452954 [Hypoxylon cercidicola]